MSFSEWKEVRLGDICVNNKGSYGIAASAVKYSKKLFTYLRITDISDDGVLNKEGLKSVDDNNAEKYLLEPNDIVFARTGNSTGRSYFYDGKDGKLVFAGFLIKFSLDPNKVNPKFMKYYTLSDEYKSWVKSFSSGSTRGNINAQTYANMKINLPPREQQNLLVKNLSILDEKIEVNNQINKKLEEMAQTIFKRWFVDFEFPCLPENYKFSGAGETEEGREGYSEAGVDELESLVADESKDYIVGSLGSDMPEDFERVCTYKRVGGLPVPDGKSWFVYVLLGEDGSFYKGMTKDLYRRFYEHYKGIGAKWTNAHKPVKVIHYEQFDTKEAARKREVELKTGYGREWLKREYEKYKAGLPAPKTKLRQAGETIESKLGLIPKGWEVCNLGEVGEIVMGQSPKGTSYNEVGAGTVFYQGRTDFGERYPTQRLFTTEPKRMAQAGDILMSVRAPVGDINVAFEDCCIGRGLCSIRSRGSHNSYLYYLMFTLKDKFGTYNSEGTVFGSITKERLNSMQVLAPSPELTQRYDDIIGKLDQQYLWLVKQNRHLTSIRDLILPKLMSGEVRVPLD